MIFSYQLLSLVWLLSLSRSVSCASIMKFAIEIITHFSFIMLRNMSSVSWTIATSAQMECYVKKNRRQTSQRIAKAQQQQTEPNNNNSCCAMVVSIEVNCIAFSLVLVSIATTTMMTPRVFVSIPFSLSRVEFFFILAQNQIVCLFQWSSRTFYFAALDCFFFHFLIWVVQRLSFTIIMAWFIVSG